MIYTLQIHKELVARNKNYVVQPPTIIPEQILNAQLNKC
jgi:nitrate reductase cytochrome c-type subunit